MRKKYNAPTTRRRLLVELNSTKVGVSRYIRAIGWLLPVRSLLLQMPIEKVHEDVDRLPLHRVRRVRPVALPVNEGIAVVGMIEAHPRRIPASFQHPFMRELEDALQ